MSDQNNFDVIIIGGSFSGLAAGMALGRAMKSVLIIDSAKPCNAQSPYSHNFITQDGKAPSKIISDAKNQVLQYESIKFIDGVAINAFKSQKGFEIKISTDKAFQSDNLIFATGIHDIFPPIPGFADCWGISVLHCPFCHGYEVRNEKTGIILSDITNDEFTILVSNWTSELFLFTNGPSKLRADNIRRLKLRNVTIIENKISSLEHKNGLLECVVFEDGSRIALPVMYAPVPFRQHCKLPEDLGCELTKEGYMQIDSFNETTIKNIYACGDNVSRMRTVANAVATGTATGMILSKRIIMNS